MKDYKRDPVHDIINLLQIKSLLISIGINRYKVNRY